VSQSGELDPRLRGWQERYASRAAEAAESLAAVRGVTGIVLGGSLGRGQHWPLSDIDIMVVCAGRPVAETAADVDMQAYQLSALWGTGGIYTGVDAGRLVYDEAEVREVVDSAGATVEHLGDGRWMHGVDKMYAGVAVHDSSGAAQMLVDWSARMRFDKEVVRRRIEIWLASAEQVTQEAERLGTAGDLTGAWVKLRAVTTALAEVATDLWQQRAGSLGRYWSLFEERARQHGGSDLADEIIGAGHVRPDCVCRRLDGIPEWLEDRIALSYSARRLVGESVTPEQNVRDNLLAYALLYRSRFPSAQFAWMRAEDGADLGTSIGALRDLIRRLRSSR
jgi:predicted nucleotidyltransferase